MYQPPTVLRSAGQYSVDKLIYRQPNGRHWRSAKKPQDTGETLKRDSKERQ